MNDGRKTPVNPWTNEPQRQPQDSPRRTRVLGAAVGVLVVVVLIVVGAWALIGGDSDDSDTASGESSGTVTAVAPVTTVTTVTVEPEETVAEETFTGTTSGTEPQSTASGSGPAESAGSGPLACDGRGVLIVNSIMDDAADFDAQLANSRARWPDAVVMSPGDCPSLRPAHPDSGAAVYAVVIDYGDDLAGLCAAEIPGERNARLLNGDTSYRSPC